MKQQASMYEQDIHDGALVWLTAPSNQIAEETLYLPSISTISGSTVLGDYESIQPLGFDADNYQQWFTITTWEVVSTIGRYVYMSYVLQLSTYIFLDFIMFLRYLVVNDHIPEPSIWKKITNYLIMVFGQTQAHYLQQLPKTMPWWGKVCIRNGGDCIHAAIAQCDNSKNHEASFVQVHYQFLIIYFLLKLPITVWNTCWYKCASSECSWTTQMKDFLWLTWICSLLQTPRKLYPWQPRAYNPTPHTDYNLRYVWTWCNPRRGLFQGTELIQWNCRSQNHLRHSGLSKGRRCLGNHWQKWSLCSDSIYWWLTNGDQHKYWLRALIVFLIF